MSVLHPLSQMFNEKIKRLSIHKNCVYLNKDTIIELDSVDGARWMVIGDAGSGKTYQSSIVLNQFKNVFFFDPTSRFRDTLTEQGLEDKWVYKFLSPKKKKRAFKINVQDLGKGDGIIHILFPRSEDSDKKRLQRQAVEEFLDRKTKTYEDWEEMCDKKKLNNIFTDLRWILSEDDSAPDILEMAVGRTVIDISEMSVRNPSLGVFLQSLISARRRLKKKQCLNPSNFVVVALDEAQDYCRQFTPVGEAFATLNLQARKYGLGELLIGSAYDNFHPDVRSKSNMKFVFLSPGITNQYRREGVDINMDDWDKLRKNECFIFSSDGEFNGVINNDICFPDLYFKDVKKLNRIPKYVVKQKNSSFSVSKLFR